MYLLARNMNLPASFASYYLFGRKFGLEAQCLIRNTELWIIVMKNYGFSNNLISLSPSFLSA